MPPVDDDEAPEAAVEHRADVEVVMLLASPAHRYGGRPRDGAAPSPPAPESVGRALGVVGRGMAGDRCSLRREHADAEALRGAAFTLDCGEGPVSLRGGRPTAPCSWMDAVFAPGGPRRRPCRAPPRATLTGMEPLPTKSALVRIGKALAAGTETDEQLDQLDVLLGRCNEVGRNATETLTQALADMVSDTGGRLSVRGRTKTLVTLREKLTRMGGHQLPVIRDLVGLRIVGDMTLDDQDLVLLVAFAALGIAKHDVKVIDRRDVPAKGYRALHGEIALDGLKVEIQVRTSLQHEWAEVYEKMGDRFGRSIRYPDEEATHGPHQLRIKTVRVMSDVSRSIRHDEENNHAHTGRRLIEQLMEEERTGQRPLPVKALTSSGERNEALERLRSSTAEMIHLSQQQQERLRDMLATLASMVEVPHGEDGP